MSSDRYPSSSARIDMFSKKMPRTSQCHLVGNFSLRIRLTPPEAVSRTFVLETKAVNETCEYLYRHDRWARLQALKIVPGPSLHSLAFVSVVRIVSLAVLARSEACLTRVPISSSQKRS